MTSPVSLSPVSLRHALTDLFDDEELRTLCFDIGVDYDNLRGEGKAAKARELVAWAKRTSRLAEMEATVRRTRPALGTVYPHERVQDTGEYPATLPAPYEQHIGLGGRILIPGVRVALCCLAAGIIIVAVVMVWGDPLLQMVTSVTAAATPTPTFAPTLTSTPRATPDLTLTATPLVYPVPTLIEADIEGCVVDLKWNWTWGLGEDEWFALRVAKVPDVPRSFVWLKGNAFTWVCTEAGEYTWEVAICHGDPSAGHCSKTDGSELTVSERGIFKFEGCQPPPARP